MNAERRKSISEIIERITSLREEIESAQSDLSSIADEEEEARDNMAAQSGPNYEASEEASDYMSEADSYFDDVLSALGEAVSSLENITG